MSNLKKTSYVFIALAIALLLAAISISVAFNVNKAYADYQDVISDPNSIVNFNQLISDNYNHNSILPSGQNIHLVDNLHAGDIVYIKIDIVVASQNYYFEIKDVNNTVLYTVRSHLTNRNDNYFLITLPNDSNYLNFWSNNNINCNYLVFINLTQMFGSGNEPNLQQAKDLFISDFYHYDTGSAMSFGTIDSYNKGVEDTLNSFDLTLSQYLVGSSAFAFNNSSISGSTISYDNTVNSYVFKNVIGVPLMDTIESGTNFTVDFTLWDLATGESQSYYMSQYLNFGYVDSNNNLINISKLPSTAYVGEDEVQYTGVFVLPVSTDTIYIWVSYNNDLFSDDSFIALDSNITFRSLNVASLIKASYAAGLQYNKDFYSVGGAGYNQIYQSGYHAGMLVETPYTFSHLLTAVIEAPLGAVLEIFNFDFMGYNFKNFITVMFTLCLIIAIVRMFMGGKE